MILERAQITRLLAAASSLKSVMRSPIRAAVMRLAVVLLYTAGLRRGELTRLTLSDTDAFAGSGFGIRSSTSPDGFRFHARPARSCAVTLRFGAEQDSIRAQRPRCSAPGTRGPTRDRDCTRP
jgi:integrase